MDRVLCGKVLLGFQWVDHRLLIRVSQYEFLVRLVQSILVICASPAEKLVVLLVSVYAQRPWLPPQPVPPLRQCDLRTHPITGV